MSLQFIIGNSGAGKSFRAYQRVIREAAAHPEKMYYVIVPEQFTMQTQKTLVEMHPQKGILNIDVLSFERLAYRIFEEVGGDTRKVLEETGKKYDSSETGAGQPEETGLSEKPDEKTRISG